VEPAITNMASSLTASRLEAEKQADFLGDLSKQLAEDVENIAGQLEGSCANVESELQVVQSKGCM